MLTPGQIALARALDRATMSDTWKCERSSRRTFDDVTGQWSAATTEVVYVGPGRLSDRGGVSRRDETQGETTSVGSHRLALPIDISGQVRVDDVLVCAAAPYDPHLVGMSVRVVDVDAFTHASARLLSVEVESWPTT